MKNHLCSESISNLFGNDENTDGKSSFMLKAGSETDWQRYIRPFAELCLSCPGELAGTLNEFKQFIRCSRKSSLFAG